MKACPNLSSRLLFPFCSSPKGTAILPPPLSTLSPSHGSFSYCPVGVRDPHSHQNQPWKPRSHAKRVEHREGEEEERPVHCEVEVVSWRERQVKARVLVHADVESVWRVLTDYERLADFIPNLVYSGRIPCPYQGRVWLEQRGLQRALYWQIEARVVLDLQELPNSASARELQFTMVDGDFKKFEGKWSVSAGPRSTAILTYEVSVIPRYNFPAIFLERIIVSDLPVNLRALAFRAERITEEIEMAPFSGNFLSSTCKASFPVQSLEVSGVPFKTSNQISDNLKDHTFSSIPPANIEFNSKWGVYGKVCRLDRRCIADEIHLRRFDGLLENGGSHRGVVASITVKATVHEVWNVLTAYEELPEIVPNLAISKILLRDNSKVRILQEGCKGLLYMVLHARVVLDLHEKHEKEISFEQVEGDFDSFQGKWLLEQLGNQHTLLKYIVESKIHNDIFLSEAIVEEVVYEDLPSNLCAIRDFIENRVISLSNHPNCSDKAASAEDIVHLSKKILQKEHTGTSFSSTLKHRPKVPDLQTDIEVLKAEIAMFIEKHGQEGFMPMRKHLRMHGRVDIEKAITRMGGFRKLANMMNLSLAYKHRKPKGYWDNLDNLQEEISRFQKSWGMDPAYMPSRKSFERAGRYDIARALEKWGGVQEVSRLLSLELRHPKKADGVGDPNFNEEPSDKGKISGPRERPFQ
ncbi:hypothetical protein HPP92_024774 [Vanilla planifolia]|uniref:Coenzyme Q-binding protein COQ10 START domain-containing protein n=1 Tax=Vanilla planifolia TaxID=51239 RepID=A0A835PGM8_VANPL|nr:hypothetical protein HPP92_024774 [Vanilla planifolia]